MRQTLKLTSAALLTVVGVCRLTGIGIAGHAADQSAPQRQPPAPAARILRQDAVFFVVDDLGKAIEFYRDGVGLDLNGTPAPLTDSALVKPVSAAAPGARARFASLKIPGSDLRLKLVQFSNVDRRKATKARLYDPGVVRFLLNVRDMKAALERVTSRGIQIPTTGGAPVFTQRPRNNAQGIMMIDPQGFVFEFIQQDVEPGRGAPGASNILNARLSLVVDSLDKTTAFYRDVFGFESEPPVVVNEAVRRLEGTPSAVVRSQAIHPPGDRFFYRLWEFSNVADRRQLRPRLQDPGTQGMSLWVENLPAFLTAAKAAGAIVDTGEEPLNVDLHTRSALVRDPNGIALELLETAH